MSSLLLPPSPNWFQPNGLSTRPEDALVATACFKSIVVYKIDEEQRRLTPLKLIPFTVCKVTGVSIYPDSTNSELGHTLAASGDQNRLALIDMHSGNFLAQQKVNSKSLNSLCWGCVKGDDIVVAVGDKGSMVVWQPKHQVAKSFNLDPKRNLSVVKIVPHLTSQALVACDRNIFLVSLQTGDIINQYKGHDSTIYCISWYLGSKNPREVDALQTNTRWKRDEADDQKESSSGNPSEKEKKPVGPFFASSDLGKTILVWDFSAKRYLTSVNAPYSSATFKKGGKDRVQGKNLHITLNWCQDRLYSSSVIGEIIEWNLNTPEPKYKMMIHSHSRAIYNMEVVGNLILTTSQDRTLQAYDVASSSSFFNMFTIGTCANSLAFSPHDANRLAIGMQDEMIKLVTFAEKAPLKMYNIHGNIKGRVMSVAWHPGQEGKLLFGTSDGQVGIADIFSSRISTFAVFHQKSAYKVEWGTAVAPAKTGLKEKWYAYSFGDREVLCRNPLNVMQDPVSLNPFLNVEKNSNNGFCLSEFSFSPDYQYLALGSLNGEVKILDCATLECRIVISRVRKVIQHLSWKLPTSSDLPFVLGIASGENSVYIFDLEKDLKDAVNVEEPLILTHPKRELVAHAGRVIWLSWSPHTDGHLASGSYDHTVQIWDTNTGEPICNYGGHTHRVFRVEFSPTNPDKVLSFGEENFILEWQPSKLNTRTPSESAACLKEFRKKNRVCLEEPVEQKVESTNGSSDTSSNVGKSREESSTPSASSRKNAPKKSSFPLLHNFTVRKKSFHHMCLLSLLEAKLVEKKETATVNNEENLDEDFEEELKIPNGAENEEKDLESHVAKALKRYSHFMPPGQPLPETEDVCFYLNYFGSLPHMDKVIKKEIKNHETNENFDRSSLMHCWQGTLESHIRWAAKHKCLNNFLIAAAPQVSFALWEYACEAYAEQLVEQAEDPVTAATYLVSIHKDEEAVNLLVKHKLFREALAIAKYKMGFNHEILEKVLNAWFSTAVFEGNFELASVLQICLGNLENAARTLARRTEPSSLIVAAFVYYSCQCYEMARSTAVLAFKEASSKNEFSKFAPILKEIPNLEWCKCIHICHQSVYGQVATLNPSLSSYEVDSGVELETAKPGNILAKVVRRNWTLNGIIPEVYLNYCSEIRANLPTQKTPTSLKNLWFITSIALSEMFLLTAQEEKNEAQVAWEACLDSILKYISFWGKTDQIFYLTHILLPNGVEDLSTLEAPWEVIEASWVVQQLQGLYISSEAKIILGLLEGDKSYVPWKESATRGQDTSSLCKEEEELEGDQKASVGEKTSLNGETNISETCPGETNISETCPGETNTPEACPTSTVEVGPSEQKERHVKSLIIESNGSPGKGKTQPEVRKDVCDKLCLYKSKDDFILSFETNMSSVKKYFLSSTNAEEYMTLANQIVTLLQGRDEISFSHNLFGKVEG